jgi:hypothetical protein
MRPLGRCDCGGGGTAINVVVLPNFVAALREVDQGSPVLQVDSIPDIGGYLAEEEKLLYVVRPRSPVSRR